MIAKAGFPGRTCRTHVVHHRLISPHVVASQKVSIPEASCLPLLVFPAGRAVHTWLTTFSLASQDAASHKVSIPDASCSPLLVAGHTTHTLFTTFSFVPQDVASHDTNAAIHAGCVENPWRSPFPPAGFPWIFPTGGRAGMGGARRPWVFPGSSREYHPQSHLVSPPVPHPRDGPMRECHQIKTWDWHDL